MPGNSLLLDSSSVYRPNFKPVLAWIEFMVTVWPKCYEKKKYYVMEEKIILNDRELAHEFLVHPHKMGRAMYNSE